MLLTRAGPAEVGPVDELTERARKIQPRRARGELHRVAVGHNLAEAELIQGILLEEGIPSLLRRSGGFDVPDFLAAGPRDVMVPASGVETARELLAFEDQPLIEREPDDFRTARVPAGGGAARLPARLRRAHDLDLGADLLSAGTSVIASRPSCGPEGPPVASSCTWSHPDRLDLPHPGAERRLERGHRAALRQAVDQQVAGVPADLAVEQVEDAAAEDDRVAGRGRERRAPTLVEPPQHRWAEARVLPGVVLGATLDQPRPAQVAGKRPRSPRRRNPRVVGGEDELGVEALRGAAQGPQRIRRRPPAAPGRRRSTCATRSWSPSRPDTGAPPALPRAGPPAGRDELPRATPSSDGGSP